eukprot:1746868-Pleurochrysis_carterae.AAC.2
MALYALTRVVRMVPASNLSVVLVEVMQQLLSCSKGLHAGTMGLASWDAQMHVRLDLSASSACLASTLVASVMVVTRRIKMHGTCR